MVSLDQPLIQLLALMDLVWVEPEPQTRGRGAPRIYSEWVMFKVYAVSVLKKLWERRALWRFLQANPTVAAACGLPQLPDRRTLDRRLDEIGSHAEEQIRVLGFWKG